MKRDSDYLFILENMEPCPQRLKYQLQHSHGCEQCKETFERNEGGFCAEQERWLDEHNVKCETCAENLAKMKDRIADEEISNLGSDDSVN